MDAKVKADWLKALRSDEYEQGHGTLRTQTGFCCLGVLCDILEPEEWKEDTEGYTHRGCTGSPIPELRTAIGLLTEDTTTLIMMNDGGERDGKAYKSKGFNDIADWIEEHI